MLTLSKSLFISYAPKDSQFALWLYDRIKQSNIHAWIDARDIRPGQNWDEAVRNALDEKPVLVIIHSSAWNLTPFTKNDADYALKNGLKVIAATIDKSKLPIRLQQIPNINFFRRDEDEAFAELLNLITDEVEVNEPDEDDEESPQMDRFHLSAAPETEETRLIRDYYAAHDDPQRELSRVAAARWLGERQTQNTVLLDMLRDPAPLVRQEAAIALARIGSAVSKPALQIAALQDDSLAVRLYASIALLAYDSPASIPAWLNNIVVANPDPALKEALSAAQLRMNELLINAPKHIFISYTRRDAESFTFELASSLRSNGFSVWIDTNLEAGTAVWVHEIEKAIRQAGVCLVILSPAIHDSEWVPKEVSFARQFKKPIIPIKYLETHKPLYLSTEQGLREDLPFADQYDHMLQSLIQSMEKFVSRVS